MGLVDSGVDGPANKLRRRLHACATRCLSTKLLEQQAMVVGLERAFNDTLGYDE